MASRRSAAGLRVAMRDLCSALGAYSTDSQARRLADSQTRGAQTDAATRRARRRDWVARCKVRGGEVEMAISLALLPVRACVRACVSRSQIFLLLCTMSLAMSGSYLVCFEAAVCAMTDEAAIPNERCHARYRPIVAILPACLVCSC